MARQLNIRSDEAYDIAHRIARQSNRPITEIVRDALRDYGAKVVGGMTPEQLERYQALRDLAKRTSAMKRPGATSAHGEMYDENGLPK